MTSADEAVRTQASGVGCLALQGPDAGGHRATFDASAHPGTEHLEEVVVQVRRVSSLPLVVAGGITARASV